MLLHGNETSGLAAVQEILRCYAAARVNRTLIGSMAYVEAAAANAAMLRTSVTSTGVAWAWSFPTIRSRRSAVWTHEYVEVAEHSLPSTSNSGFNLTIPSPAWPKYVALAQLLPHCRASSAPRAAPAQRPSPDYVRRSWSNAASRSPMPRGACRRIARRLPIDRRASDHAPVRRTSSCCAHAPS